MDSSSRQAQDLHPPSGQAQDPHPPTGQAQGLPLRAHKLDDGRTTGIGGSRRRPRTVPTARHRNGGGRGQTVRCNVRSVRRHWALAILICLAALALRVHRLAEPLVRWDEGWSVAHASLSWLEIVQIASLEVHPPLFYLLLKPWLALGRDVFLVRFFPVLVSVLAVPLTFRVAMRWAGAKPGSFRKPWSLGDVPTREGRDGTPFRGRARLAYLAAALTALAPALVYYAQVTRMYPMVVLWLLLATWALLDWIDGGGNWTLVGLGAAGLAALYTFYYTAWALLGLYGYGLLASYWSARTARSQRRGAQTQGAPEHRVSAARAADRSNPSRPTSITGLVVVGAVTLALYVPWLAYAGSGMLERMAESAPDAAVMPPTLWSLLASTWTALTFDFGTGGWAALAVLGVLLAAVLIAVLFRRPRRGEGIRLLMPIVALVVATGGVVLSSGAYFFAARLLTPAVPFLILLVAWSLDRLCCLGKGFLVAGLAVLCVTFWPTSSRFVYEKSLEVSGPFDPHEYHAMLAGEQARPDEFVFFNELALAGWYEMDRTPQDPAWGYALRWTPIVEPMARIEPRVMERAAGHERLWFVLYRGTSGPGAELKAWLDGTLYPYGLGWGSESLFLSYLAPKAPWVEVASGLDFGGGIRLDSARYSSQVGPGGEVGVELQWRAIQTPLPDCRVVLQVWDETGAVLAHRDVRPFNWDRPTHQWAVGEVVVDHHGLLVSGGSDTRLHLAVSLYDADTGEALPVAGGTYWELGSLEQ